MLFRSGMIMLVIAVLSKLLEIRRQTRFDEIAEVSAAQEMFAVAENESPADDNMEPLTLPPLK